MKHYKIFLKTGSRLCAMHSLLFCIITLLICCRNNDRHEISLVWKQQKAVAVRIPFEKIPGNRDDAAYYLSVRLETPTPVIGNYRVDGDLIFEPLVPFSPGTKYLVYFKHKTIGSFTVPVAPAENAPVVLNIYPGADTVPVNLLKVYILFSQPMQQNVSGRYVRLVKNGKDTLKDVFLDLQPELWNEEVNLLTLWLDPGRIKRNLQPNMRLGNPLEENTHYTLAVSNEWKSSAGLPLKQSVQKSFITGARAEKSPSIDEWTIKLPAVNSTDELVIDMHQPLDHFLLMECFALEDEKGNRISGDYYPAGNDHMCRFFPATRWKPGAYRLIVQSKLEDLAGNNLNRQFDRDITKTAPPSDAGVHTRNFRL